MRERRRRLRVGKAMLLAAASVAGWPVAGSAQVLEPYIPPAPTVSISNHVVLGAVWVDVSVVFGDTCDRLGDWSTPVQTLPTITVNTVFWRAVGVACGNVVTTVSHSYSLGYLAPGNYQFVFEVWGQKVVTYWFTVRSTDSDGDGMSDYEESIAGTDPQNPNSVLKIIGCQIEGGQAKVTWQVGTGVRQYLDRRTELNGTNSGWVCVFTNNPPTAVTNTWVDPLGADGVQFYRIRVVK